MTTDNPYQAPIGGGQAIEEPTRSDEDFVRLLSVFHYVVAGVSGVFALFPGLYILMGVMFMSGAFDNGSGPPPPKELGIFFIGFGAVGMLVGLAFSFMLFFAGRRLGKYRSRTFCLVAAGISCFFFPFGTALGITTIVAMIRPGVRTLFDRAEHAAA